MNVLTFLLFKLVLFLGLNSNKYKRKDNIYKTYARAGMFDRLLNYIKILPVQISKRVFPRELHFKCFFKTSHSELFDDGFRRISQMIIKPQKPFSMNRFDYGKFQGHLNIIIICLIVQLMRNLLGVPAIELLF